MAFACHSVHATDICLSSGCTSEHPRPETCCAWAPAATSCEPSVVRCEHPIGTSPSCWPDVSVDHRARCTLPPRHATVAAVRRAFLNPPSLPPLALLQVVAQLCTSNNRVRAAAAAAAQETFDEATAAGLSSRKEQFLSCNPINRLTTKAQATKLSDPQPEIRYFGVDCRPGRLLRYGRFATAFHFDPCNLDNPDAIASMLATLEPLKGAVHFCLIGAGEALIRQEWGANAEQLQQALSDARSQLNAMAMFLLKRHFP